MAPNRLMQLPRVLSLDDAEPSVTRKDGNAATSTDCCFTGDGTRKCLLPCFNFESAIRITPSTLLQCLDGVFADNLTNFVIFDCRYPYEFEGGHIAGAVNVPSFDRLQQYLQQHQQDLKETTNNNNSSRKRSILILHCEFSSQRAPAMLRQLRSADRAANQDRYPSLDYPEIYLLEGGYKAFFDYCQANDRLSMIEQSGYVTMRDERFRDEERRWRRLVHSEPASTKPNPKPTNDEEGPTTPLKMCSNDEECRPRRRKTRSMMALNLKPENCQRQHLVRRLFDDEADDNESSVSSSSSSSSSTEDETPTLSVELFETLKLKA